MHRHVPNLLTLSIYWNLSSSSSSYCLIDAILRHHVHLVRSPLSRHRKYESRDRLCHVWAWNGRVCCIIRPLKPLRHAWHINLIPQSRLQNIYITHTTVDITRLSGLKTLWKKKNICTVALICTYARGILLEWSRTLGQGQLRQISFIHGVVHVGRVFFDVAAAACMYVCMCKICWKWE